MTLLDVIVTILIGHPEYELFGTKPARFDDRCGFIITRLGIPIGDALLDEMGYITTLVYSNWFEHIHLPRAVLCSTNIITFLTFRPK